MRTYGLLLASFLVVLGLAFVAAPASAGPALNGVASPYNSFAAFKKAADAAKKDDPKEVAVLLVQALVARSMDERLGNSMIAQITLPKQRKSCLLCAGGLTISRSVEDELANLSSYVLEGYCGGTPAGKYADAKLKSCVPTIDADYSAKMQGIKGAKAKYYFANGGSGRPRPVTLKLLAESEGSSAKVWLVYAMSGLLPGVMPPEK